MSKNPQGAIMPQSLAYSFSSYFAATSIGEIAGKDWVGEKKHPPTQNERLAATKPRDFSQLPQQAN